MLTDQIIFGVTDYSFVPITEYWRSDILRGHVDFQRVTKDRYILADNSMWRSNT